MIRFSGSMINLNTISFNRFKAITGNNNKNRSNKLSIWYCNDIHGNSDKMHGVMEAARAFKNQKKDSAHFLLSAGDNVSGADEQKNEFILNVMQNIMSLDASAVGNHEIDASSQGFDDELKDKKINFIATNAKFDSDNPLNDIVKKYIIKEQDGVKYAFLGTMPLDFKSCTKKSVQDDIDVMDFDETIIALQNQIDELKKQGINRIILLSHSGFDMDKKMASNLDGIDIIIGGHTHSVVDGSKKDYNLVNSKSNEPVIITQAGENGNYYGILDVEFDNDGILTNIINKLYSTNGKKSPTIEYIKDQKLGKSPQIANIKSIQPMPKNRRNTPHAWANLIVDSMRAHFNSDIALMNAANVRKVPQEGKLTQRDVSESVPMKNKLIRTKVTQKQVVEAIKQACKETLNSSEGTPGLLFTSGLSYKTNDKGELLELYYIDKKGVKTKIDIDNPREDILYDAIYDEFVMMDDGEYPKMAPKKEVEHFTFDKDETAIKYISNLPDKDNLDITDDKRIEIVQTSKPTQTNNSIQKFLSLTSPKAS